MWQWKCVLAQGGSGEDFGGGDEQLPVPTPATTGLGMDDLDPPDVGLQCASSYIPYHTMQWHRPRVLLCGAEDFSLYWRPSRMHAAKPAV